MSADSPPELAAEPCSAAPSAASAKAPWLDRAARVYARYQGVGYALFAMWCTLYVAASFYSYLLKQTGGVWSAPLDDVFIHFDYARSFARGYPFQWCEGNGYSSGNTSLSYPVVLALGYWLGFRGQLLMLWAAAVASVSVYGFLLAAGRLVVGGSTADRDPRRALRWSRMLIPPAVLSMGALDWTLFSGMENAFHLAVWGLCLVMALRQADVDSAWRARRRAWLLGACGALLVATRPESGICVAAFAFYAAWRSRERGLARGWRPIVRIIVAAAWPAVGVLLIHAAANRILTGEWSAAGAIAKLFINDPYMSGADMLARYRSLLSYILARLLFHHFSAVKYVGLLIPLLAAVPLFSRRLRPLAVMLWFQVVGWLLIVALNNQLRWQNARYAMPTVAWLLLLAALGVGVLASRQGGAKAPWRLPGQPLRVAAAAALVGLYWWAQAPRMKDQIWFFGRASRNILDQHISAGLVLKKMGAKRILVGDAGALIYAADRPGVDLIGLGGMHDYPFARATRHGLGATIEQIERLPVDDRPDVMALYPSWWGDLPHLFGSYLSEIPVRGNVICGGPEKVLYRANWSALDRRGLPRTLAAGQRAFDQLDVADLVSERAHDYHHLSGGFGFVRYRLLEDPRDSRRDLFDAGRIVKQGQTVSMQLSLPVGAAELVVRVAPERAILFTVARAGQPLGSMTAQPSGGWQELSLPLPPEWQGKVQLALTNERGDAILYHMWIVHP